MDTVRVKYSGPKKQMIVALPVPFVAKCESEGQVEFIRQKDAVASWADVPAQYVDILCQPGGLFAVDTPPVDAPAAAAPVPPPASADDEDAKKQAARDRMAKARAAKEHKARENGGLQ